MAKKVRKIAGTARKPQRHASSAAARETRRWWGIFTKTVLGIGALASAIGATISLWPAADPNDSGKLDALKVVIVPLSESRSSRPTVRMKDAPPARSSRRGTDGGNRALIAMASNLSTDAGSVTSDVGTEPPPADPTESPATPTVEATPSRPGGPTAAPTSNGPTPEDGATTLPPVIVLDPTRPFDLTTDQVKAVGDEFADLAGEQLPGQDLDCFTSEPPGCLDDVLPLVGSSEGEEVTAKKAAQRLVELLKETRTSKARKHNGKVQPLGALVTVNIEVTGLRKSPIRLTWSLLRDSKEEASLPDRWHTNTTGYTFTPTTESDTGSASVWVPLPKEAGPYFIRLGLQTGDSLLTSTDTSAFG